MSWKEQLNKAVAAVKTAAESDAAQGWKAKATQKAAQLAQKARAGALDAAQAFVEANADHTAFKCQFLNVRLSVLSPSNGFEIATPGEGTLVVSDGQNNGLVINAGAEPAYVAETIGKVTRLNASTYDLGAEDGINVVVVDT